MAQSREQRRESILGEIRQIDRLRRGTLSEQYFERTLHSGETRRQGPYYVLQHQRDGKKQSQRIPAEQVAQVREDVAGYERLMSLTGEWVDLTEQMTCAADAIDSKKKLRRSKRSVSGKPSSSSP